MKALSMLAGSTLLATMAVAAPAGAADACALLSKADMSAITGQPMADGAKPSVVPPASADVTFSQCTWTTAEGDDPVTVSVRTSKKGDGEPAYARQVAVDSGMKVEDVAGLGDAAFWTGMQLQVFRGRHLQIVVSLMGHAAPKDKAVQVARKALAGL
jgi:hypothetical protein